MIWKYQGTHNLFLIYMHVYVYFMVLSFEKEKI